MKVKSFGNTGSGEDRLVGTLVSELVTKAMDDDGAALQLAVKFRLNIQHGTWPSGIRYVSAQRLWNSNDSCYYEDGIEYGNDPCAATRLAIVRAASNIYKTNNEDV